MKETFASPPSDWKTKTAWFLISQALSLFGSALVQFAIIWHITLTSMSGAMVTIATLCAFLPQVLISLLAGVWADRYNRKYLILGADSAIALSTLILAVLFLSGYESFWLLFLILGLRSLGAGIQTPAVGALLPQIVPSEQLLRINGLNGTFQSLIMLIAPAASGALYSIWPLGKIFFVDVITAVIAVIIMAMLKVPPHKNAGQIHQAGYLEDLFLGLNYVKNHTLVRHLLVFNALFMFLLVPAAFLTPLFVARVFGEEVWRLTANEIAFSGGAMLGGIIITLWGNFKNRVHVIAFTSIFFGITMALLGISLNFIMYLSIMFISGIGLPFFNAPFISLIQERVSEEMQGRVFSLVQIISTTTMPIGMIIFGPLSDFVSIRILLLITGILIALLGVRIFYNRSFVTAGSDNSIEKTMPSAEAPAKLQ